MARVRCITGMGMAVDVHGGENTKAARRSVSDAIRHSTLGFIRPFGKSARDMRIDVPIAAPSPETVDHAPMAAELPLGRVTVPVQQGGLEVPADGDADPIVNAAVLMHLEFDEPSA